MKRFILLTFMMMILLTLLKPEKRRHFYFIKTEIEKQIDHDLGKNNQVVINGKEWKKFKREFSTILIKEDMTYHDFIVFNLYKKDNKIITFGIFGMVIMMNEPFYELQSILDYHQI